MNEKNLQMFATGSIPKTVLKNALPSVVSMIMVLVYNLADTFFIGQTHDPLMVAAVSLATPVFLIFMAIGTLFGVGGTSVISRALGANRPEYAKKVSSFCVWTGIGIGLISMAVIFLFMDPICRSIGTSDDTIEYTRQYLGTVSLCAPLVIFNVVLSNVIRAEGKPNVAMAGMLIGNIVNCVLDPLMILTFGWDVYGAAIATVIGNVCGAVYYLIFILRKKSMLSFNIRDYSAREKICTGVLAIGVPASLSNLLMSLSHIISNGMMAEFGDLAVAGSGVAIKINLVVVMLLIGFGMGVQPILGYCYGAKNEARFKSVIRFSVVFVTVMGTVLSALCYWGADLLVSLFLENPVAMDFGVRFARLILLSGPVLGVMFIMIYAVLALGSGVASLVMSVSRQGLIYIPLLFVIMAIFHTADWIIGAQVVTDYLSAILCVVVYFVTSRRHFAKLNDPLSELTESTD